MRKILFYVFIFVIGCFATLGISSVFAQEDSVIIDYEESSVEDSNFELESKFSDEEGIRSSDLTYKEGISYRYIVSSSMSTYYITSYEFLSKEGYPLPCLKMNDVQIICGTFLIQSLQ